MTFNGNRINLGEQCKYEFSRLPVDGYTLHAADAGLPEKMEGGRPTCKY